jgi:hypothetical protein
MLSLFEKMLFLLEIVKEVLEEFEEEFEIEKITNSLY